jgi:hypothetical protein
MFSIIYNKNYIKEIFLFNFMIILFNKACIFDKLNKKIKLFGHYGKMFNDIQTSSIINNFKITFSSERPDFLIEYNIDHYNDNIFIENLVFIFNDNYIVFSNLKLEFPFENLNIKLDSNKSAIISTMCKNYSHRLDEWIQYNLKLGFSAIIIFNNDENNANPNNEPIDYCVMNKTMKEITDKYKDKVLLIDFPYTPFPYFDWMNIQRNTLTIGFNAMKEHCRNIAFIDADEFIYINNIENIEDFLSKYNNTITMKSNLITNKNDNDIIDNNIIDLAEYLGEDKYNKTILYTKIINENEFIASPHIHPTEIILDKDTIIHYHVWINNRYKYNDSMKKISCLKEFYYK